MPLINFYLIITVYVTIPPRPPEYVIFETISLYGWWSISGSDRGIAHFFIATRNTIKGVGEKEKKTNNMLGLIQVQEEKLCNIAFPMCICRLMLTWISSEISTKLLGMPTYLDRSSLTALDPLSCQLLTSAVRSRLPTGVTLCQLPSLSSFVQLVLCSLTHFRPHRDHGLRPLFGSRQNRQGDCLLGRPPT